MASKGSPSDHRLYKVRGRLTHRRRVQMMARSKGSGEKQLYKAAWQVTSCGLCEWVRSSDAKTLAPVTVRVGPSRFAQCPNGHRWRIL